MTGLLFGLASIPKGEAGQTFIAVLVLPAQYSAGHRRTLTSAGPPRELQV